MNELKVRVVIDQKIINSYYNMEKKGESKGERQI